MRALVFDKGLVREEVTSEADIVRALADSPLVWIDLEDQDVSVDRLLADTLKIHPMAVEDLWGVCELPKVADFVDYVHIIAHSVGSEQNGFDIEPKELDILVGRNYVVTHSGDPTFIKRVRHDITRAPKSFGRGPAWIAYTLLDHLVDDYLPLIDRYDARISALELEILEKAGSPSGAKLMAEIFALKRGLQTLRRTSIYQREVLLRLSRAEFDEIPNEASPFFRDVYDHFARVTDLADSYRELLTNLLEAYLSVQSNRMNEVMKTLTLISTVMLPLTFIAGVYGMNFEFMPELHWVHGYPFALALMFGVGASIVIWFRHKKWV